MPTLLSLVFVAITAATPAVLEDLTVEAEEEGASVRIGFRGEPSFTTTEEPGLYLVDFSGVEGEPSVEGEIEAPGVLGIEIDPRPDGLRLRIELERWAQAEPQLEKDALVIRISRAPGVEAEGDPAEAMAAAMENLAAQVARIGEGVRGLTGDEEEGEEFVVAPMALGDDEDDDEFEVEEDEEVLAEAEDAEEEEAPEEVAAAPEPAPEPVATPAPVLAQGPVETVGRTVATQVASELVRLGFRPTPTGAMVFVALEGEAEHRWESRDGLVILELPATRIRRANDRRPLDASWFDTPVGMIRPVEDRASSTTRIEIELKRPAEISVERLGNEISIALAETPGSSR